MLTLLLCVCVCVFAHQGVSGTLGRAVSHWGRGEGGGAGSAAGQSDPVGISLQLTDCDRMTFEFPVTEW